MSRPCPTFFAGFLLLALAAAARAESVADSQAVANASAKGLDQVIYKGIVGSVLDAVPMDPVKRANLQRTNAIVSNTLSARSLSALMGISNPVLLIGGLMWGVWAASNINPEAADTNVAANPVDSGGRLETAAGLAALADSSPAGEDSTAKPVSAPNLVAMNSLGDSGASALPRPPVIKIWLPQRSY